MKLRARMKLRFFDVAAIFLSLLVIGGFSLYACGGRGTSGDLVIDASGRRWIYPLGVDRREAVNGPRGETIVVISGGKARVEDSPCPDKLCVRMPAVSRPGQWIACLPNRVFVRVQGSSDQSVDIISY